MNIMDLDEADGLTREMAEAYLDKTGWCNMGNPDIRILKPTYAGLSFKLGLGAVVDRLAHVEGRSPQAILREMNQRMRKGLPSEAAREAHAGRWVASRTDEYTHTTIVRFLVGMGGVVKLQFEDHRETFDPSAELDKWSFWPCDAHGNKLRFPAVSDAT